MTSAWNKAQGVFRSVVKFKKYRSYQPDCMQPDIQFGQKTKCNTSQEIHTNSTTNSNKREQIINEDNGTQEGRTEPILEGKIKINEENEINNTKMSIFYINEFKKNDKLCQTKQPIVVTIDADLKPVLKSLPKTQEDERNIAGETHDNMRSKNITDRKENENNGNYENKYNNYQYRYSKNYGKHYQHNSNDSNNIKTDKIDSSAQISAGSQAISKHEVEKNEEFCDEKLRLENKKSNENYFWDKNRSGENNLGDSKLAVGNKNSEKTAHAEEEVETVTEMEGFEVESDNKWKSLRKLGSKSCITDCIGLGINVENVNKNSSKDVNLCDNFKSILGHHSSDPTKSTTLIDIQKFSVPHHEKINKNQEKVFNIPSDYKRPQDEINYDEKVGPLLNNQTINITENQQTFKETRKYFSTTKGSLIEVPVYRGVSKSNMKSVFKSILETDETELHCELNNRQKPSVSDQNMLIGCKSSDMSFHIESQITPVLENNSQRKVHLLQSESKQIQEKEIEQSSKIYSNINNSSSYQNIRNLDFENTFHETENKFNNKLRPSKTPSCRNLNEDHPDNSNYTQNKEETVEEFLKNNTQRYSVKTDKKLDFKKNYVEENEFTKKGGGNSNESILEISSNNMTLTSMNENNQKTKNQISLEKEPQETENLEFKVAYSLKSQIKKKKIHNNASNKQKDYTIYNTYYGSQRKPFDKLSKRERPKVKEVLKDVKAISNDSISIIPCQYTRSAYENNTSYYINSVGQVDLPQYIRKTELKTYTDKKNSCFSERKENIMKIHITKSGRGEFTNHESKKPEKGDQKIQSPGNIPPEVRVNFTAGKKPKILPKANNNETFATRYTSKTNSVNAKHNNKAKELDFRTKYDRTTLEESTNDESLDSKLSAYMRQMKQRVIFGTQLDEGTYKEIRNKYNLTGITKNRKLNEVEENAIFFLLPKIKSKARDLFYGKEHSNEQKSSKNISYKPKIPPNVGRKPNDHDHMAEYENEIVEENKELNMFSENENKIYVPDKTVNANKNMKLNHDEIENYVPENERTVTPNYKNKLDKSSLPKHETFNYQKEKVQSDSSTSEIINNCRNFVQNGKEKKKMLTNLSSQYTKNTTMLSEKYKIQESKKKNNKQLNELNSSLKISPLGKRIKQKTNNTNITDYSLPITELERFSYDNRNSIYVKNQDKIDDFDVNDDMNLLNNTCKQSSVLDLYKNFSNAPEKEIGNKMSYNVTIKDKLNSTEKGTKNNIMENRHEKWSLNKSKNHTNNIMAKRASDLAETLDIIKADIINTIQSVSQRSSKYEPINTTDVVKNSFSKTVKQLKEHNNNLSSSYKPKIVDKTLKPTWNKPNENSSNFKYNNKISNFEKKIMDVKVYEPFKIQCTPENNKTEHFNVMSKTFDTGTGRDNVSINKYHNIKLNNIKTKKHIVQKPGNKTYVPNKKIKNPSKEKFHSHEIRKTKHKLRKSFYDLAANVPDNNEHKKVHDFYFVKKNSPKSKKSIKSNSFVYARESIYNERPHKRKKIVNTLKTLDRVKMTSSKPKEILSPKNTSLKFSQSGESKKPMPKYSEVYRKKHKRTNAIHVYDRPTKQIMRPISKSNYLNVNEDRCYNVLFTSNPKDVTLFPDKIGNTKAKEMVMNTINELKKINNKHINNSYYHLLQKSNGYKNAKREYKTSVNMKQNQTTTSKRTIRSLPNKQRGHNHDNVYRRLEKINYNAGVNSLSVFHGKQAINTLNKSINKYSSPDSSDWDPSPTDCFINGSLELRKRKDNNCVNNYDSLNLTPVYKLYK